MPASLNPASLERVRRVWRDLAGAPTAFQEPGCIIAPGERSDESRRVSVASASVAHALQAGLIPQWRARCTLTASRRIARSLGFVELGRQLSFWLA